MLIQKEHAHFLGAKSDSNNDEITNSTKSLSVDILPYFTASEACSKFARWTN